MTEQTDREMLESAAKAAGIDVYESTDGTIQNRPVLVFAAGGGMGTMPYEERWNPPTDEAQALRLAAAINQLDLLLLVGNMVADGAGAGTTGVAAICRAITYAAAKVGKAMP